MTLFASVGDRLRRHEAGPRRHRRARTDGATLPVDLDSPRRHLHLLQGLPQQVSHMVNNYFKLNSEVKIISNSALKTN